MSTEREIEMTTAIRLPTSLVNEAKKLAGTHFRSVTKQIEYWTYLGKVADENPDLPANFIKGCIEAKGEIDNGNVSKFEFIEK
jgi:hypothetical protein